MSKEQPIKSEGQVIEVLPNGEFRVQIGDGIVTCYLNGRMRMNKIKVILGDSVNIELPPKFNLKFDKGRITFRNK